MGLAEPPPVEACGVSGCRAASAGPGSAGPSGDRWRLAAPPLSVSGTQGVAAAGTASLATARRRRRGCSPWRESNGTCFQAELLCSGLVGEGEFFRALAEELGLGYQSAIDPERLIVNEAMALSLLRRPSWHIPVKLNETDGATTYLIAPDRIGLGRLRGLVRTLSPHHRSPQDCTAGASCVARFSQGSRRVWRSTATGELFERRPEYSARIVANAWQGFLFGVAVVAFPAAIWIAPLETWTFAHIVLSIFFLACVGLRVAALRLPLPSAPGIAPPPRAVGSARLFGAGRPVRRGRDRSRAGARASMPRLAEDQARDQAGLRGRRPRDAVCARRSVASLEHGGGKGSGRRPAHQAKGAGLCLAAGQRRIRRSLRRRGYVPTRRNCLQAWQTFNASAPDVVCLQAPLEISNGGSGRVPRMFAFEYATLFRGLLPWLSTRRLLLPLGGTSNHFRRSALEEVGGWDPYNVTEDADLGVRLARFGYRTETIGCPTYEAAPDTLSNLAAAAYPLVQGLDADLAGPHARPVPADRRSRHRLLPDRADPCRRHDPVGACPSLPARHAGSCLRST